MSATQNTTKVSALTASNVHALQTAQDHGLDVTLTKTTASFHGSPAEALAALDKAREALAREFGSRDTVVRSLHAVRRKLEALV